eukprot:6468262-Prymnesium_polylepis.1
MHREADCGRTATPWPQYIDLLLLGDRQPVVSEQRMHERRRCARPRGAVGDDGREAEARDSARRGRKRCELCPRFGERPRHECGGGRSQPRDRRLRGSSHEVVDTQVAGRLQKREKRWVAHDRGASDVNPFEAAFQRGGRCNLAIDYLVLGVREC